MKRILLTGSNGFLGRNLQKELSKKHQLVSLSRTNADYNIDLSTTVPKFKEEFETLIHSAGLAHIVPTTETESTLFFDVNVTGLNNLLQGLNESTLLKQFILISSVSVYGLIEGELIGEDQPLNASDPYGKSKIQAETIITNWCASKNIKLTILRLPLIVGSNPPGNLGAMIKGIKTGYYFNISGGKGRKSMVLVTDISKYILTAAEVGGIYHLTDSRHPNFYELSHTIAKQLGKKYVLSMPAFVATMMALVGNLFGSKFPINSKKLKKITSTLTFDDKKAKKAFQWDPIPVTKGFKI